MIHVNKLESRVHSQWIYKFTKGIFKYANSIQMILTDFLVNVTQINCITRIQSLIDINNKNWLKLGENRIINYDSWLNIIK